VHKPDPKQRLFPAGKTSKKMPGVARRLRLSDDPTPMYFQIKRELEVRMLSGEFQVGSQIPTEHALCDLFGVSRITARKALQMLHSDGVINRVRGRGSFVENLPKGVPGMANAQVATEVGVVTHVTTLEGTEESDSWGLRILRSMESRLLDSGFHLAPVPYTNSAADSTEQILQRIDSQRGRFAGLVLFGWQHSDSLLSQLDSRGIRWVTINKSNRIQTSNFVAVDNYGGGCQIGQIFASNRYSPAMIYGPHIETAISVCEKAFGFLHGFVHGGQCLSCVELLTTSNVEPGPEEIAELRARLLAQDRPRAVFCQGDILASNVLKIASELGLSVPDDLAVVGATGMSLAEHTSPPLTVLAQPTAALGNEVANLLLNLIKNKLFRLPGHYVPCTIDARASCPVPKPADFLPHPAQGSIDAPKVG